MEVLTQMLCECTFLIGFVMKLAPVLCLRQRSLSNGGKFERERLPVVDFPHWCCISLLVYNVSSSTADHLLFAFLSILLSARPVQLHEASGPQVSALSHKKLRYHHLMKNFSMVEGGDMLAWEIFASVMPFWKGELKTLNKYKNI